MVLSPCCPCLKQGQAGPLAQWLCTQVPGCAVLLTCVQVGVFDFGSRSSPLVLLLDRNDDPVTPLLTQWTYQVGGSLSDISN